MQAPARNGKLPSDKVTAKVHEATNILVDFVKHFSNKLVERSLH